MLNGRSIFLAVFFLAIINLYSQQKIILGTGEWFPFTDPNQINKGIVSEIVEEAFSVEGYEIEIKFYPWLRCEKMLNEKLIDMIFPYTKTAERDKKYHFSDEIVVIRTNFFYLKSKIDTLIFDDYSDLKPYRIGGVRGYFYQSVFEEANLNVEYVTENIQNIRKLLNNRIDITPIADLAGWAIIHNNFQDNYKDFAAVEYDLSNNRMSDSEIASRLMITKDNPKSFESLEAFNRGLETIKSNGVFDNILEKYGIINQ